MKKLAILFCILITLFFTLKIENIFGDSEFTGNNILENIDKIKENIADFDYIENWAKEAVLDLFKEGYIELDINNNFRPKKETTRLEALKIIMKSMKIPLDQLNTEKKIFNDIEVDDPSYIYVYTAYNKKFIQGLSNGNFEPNRAVNRAEFLKMLYTISGININLLSNNNPFSDIKPSDWFYPYVIKSYQDQIVKGFNDGEFKPYQSITNSQVAKIIYLFKRYYDADINYLKIKADNINYAMLNLYLINIARQEYNKNTPLVYDEDLSKIAQIHADFLLKNDLKPDYCGNKIYIQENNNVTEEDKLCHKNNMSSPRDRLIYHKINFKESTENIAFINTSTKSITESIITIHNTMMQLKDSEINHKTNLLGIFKKYNRIGIGIAYKKDNDNLKLFLVQTLTD